jgi:Sec-independent protein translocase protein TatA
MSFAEILVIAIVAILVIKPEQWPSVVKQIAKMIKFCKSLQDKWQADSKDLLDPNGLSQREQQAKQIDEQYKIKSSQE